MKKAVMSQLTSNKACKNSFFNPLSELSVRFPFNNVTQLQKFCPKEYHKTICLMMENTFIGIH